jgi:hypothetical protein
VGDIDIRLRCKFVTFGQSYLYFGDVQALSEVYSIKIYRISAKLSENEDWIGQMDPYIKFTMGNRLLYCTQKLE